MNHFRIRRIQYFRAAEIHKMHRMPKDKYPYQIAANQNTNVDDSISQGLFVILCRIQEIEDVVDHEWP
jgi:hypothetical protein